jgi:hypothetical protein
MVQVNVADVLLTLITLLLAFGGAAVIRFRQATQRKQDEHEVKINAAQAQIAAQKGEIANALADSDRQTKLVDTLSDLVESTRTSALSTEEERRLFIQSIEKLTEAVTNNTTVIISMSAAFNEQSAETRAQITKSRDALQEQIASLRPPDAPQAT